MRIQAAALLAILLMAGPAYAHAHLRSSTPQEGATGPAPAQLNLEFSAALEPRLSRIAVTTCIDR